MNPPPPPPPPPPPAPASAAAAASALLDQVPAPAARLVACKWSEKEDAKLREIIALQGARNWKDVSSHIPGRTHVQCLQRWNKVLKPGLKKGTWQPEEDDTLARLVSEFLDTGVDSPNWTSIAKHIEGRTAKQCRERWRCNLDPLIKKAEWSPEEDVMILNMQQALGNRWALLAKQLPGRTENAIKTRFRSLQRSLKRKWSVQEDDKIRASVQQGMNFADIAAELPRRSVNSVKVRYKMLAEGSTPGMDDSAGPAASASASGGGDGGGIFSLPPQQQQQAPPPPPAPPSQLLEPAFPPALYQEHHQQHHLHQQQQQQQQQAPPPPASSSSYAQTQQQLLMM